MRIVLYRFLYYFFFFFSSRRRHTRFDCDWSSDVCSSDLYAGLDESGTALRDSGGREIVSFDAEGPIVVREFTGTAFLLTSGEVLTSDFILRPWDADPLFDQDQPERVPSIRLLHAYFPGSTAAVDLKIEHTDDNSSTVLC